MQQTIPNRRLGFLLSIAEATGLFTAFYYYASLRIRPELFYHQNPQVFLFDSHFFYGMVGQPGGVVDYVSAFLSPLLVWGWLGALTVALLVSLICLATRGLLATLAGAGGEIVFLLPAALILMVLGQYCHPVRLCVGLSMALLCANLYARLGGQHVALRLTAFAIASALIYFATAGFYSIFACLCGCYEWSVKRQRRLGALCVVGAVAIPLAAGRWPFDLSLSEAFRGLLLPSEQHWLGIPSSQPKAVAIYTASLLFIPIVAIVLAWRRGTSAASVRSPKDPGGDNTPAADVGASERGVLRMRLAVPAAMLLLFFLADVVAFDSPKRCLLELEYHSEQQRWGDVLAWADKLPLSDARACDPRITYCVNRALYFQGNLLDRMFAYPQSLSTPSLAPVYQDIDTTSQLTPRQCSEIFFDLGRVNESEQMAYEVLEVWGNRPEVLKRLVYIYAIKGEPEAARRFLSLLESSLLHRGWARHLRRQLDTDPTLPKIRLVTSRRELTVQRDSTGDASDLETLLEGLLERDPRNRMAFEYLMAHCLLTRQIDKLAANRHLFNELDYPEFPQHIQEALIIYVANAGLSDLDLGSRPIRRETVQRFGDFLRTQQQSRSDPAAAFATLHPDFGDTYFFFSVFGHNISSLGIARPPE